MEEKGGGKMKRQGKKGKKDRKEIFLHWEGEEDSLQIHPWQDSISSRVVLQPGAMLDWEMEHMRGRKVQ